MLIAQITDMHVKPEGEMLSGTLDSFKGLADTVARLNGFAPRPDLVVATGDLTADGKPEEYEALRVLLNRLEIPWLVIAGNHDIRDNLRAALPSQPWEDGNPYLQYAVDNYPLRIVALDSLGRNGHGGQLCGERLAWLETKLGEAPDRPTVVLLHHPPFATGIGHMDRMGLEDPSGLADIVSRNRQVIRILCGHVHRPVQTLFAGVLTSTSPATSFQIQLKLDDSESIQWTSEPPAFQLHVWSNGELVSHTAYVTDYGPLERPEHYATQG